MEKKRNEKKNIMHVWVYTNVNLRCWPQTNHGCHDVVQDVCAFLGKGGFILCPQENVATCGGDYGADVGVCLFVCLLSSSVLLNMRSVGSAMAF